MNITKNQVSQNVIDIISKELEQFGKSISVTDRNEIPSTSDIPIVNPSNWLKIKNVTCVYVDMINSTKLSATERQDTMAKIYRLFTETIIRIFHEFQAPYIDVKGDGVFALFNQNQVYRAFASAVTIKTFVDLEFIRCVEQIGIDEELSIGAHIGIDRGSLLVRKFGLKFNDSRDDRQNEVWAGRTVNMAAKLSSLSKSQEILVSDRFFSTIKDSKVRKSCSCSEFTDLWIEKSIDDNKFDFKKYYILQSDWCKIHGKEYCDDILKLDDKN